MRAALVILFVLASSGCAGAPGPASSASSSHAQIRVPAPDLVKIGAGSTEASYQLGPDGRTMLVCTHGGFQKTSPLYASADGGATWREVLVAAQPAPSGDCDVAITEDGAWIVAYDTVASAAVAVSKDQGRTWVATEIAGAPLGGVDRPWLAYASGHAYLVWCDVMGVEPALCFASISTDKGLAWGQPTVITQPQDEGTLHDVMGRPVISPDGRTVRVPFAWGDGAKPDAQFWPTIVETRDAGATWTRREVSPPFVGAAQFTSVGLAGDGTLYASYVKGNGTGAPPAILANVQGPIPIQGDVYVARSVDGGATWTRTLVAPGVWYVYQSNSWVAGLPNGTGIVAWFHETDKQSGTWVVDAAFVDAAGAHGAWSASKGMTAASGIDYMMTGADGEGNALAVFVMDATIVMSRTPS